MGEKIGVIKEKFANASIEQLEEVIELYKDDERASVQKEIEKAYKKMEALAKEMERIISLSKYEKEYETIKETIEEEIIDAVEDKIEAELEDFEEDESKTD